MAILHSQFGRFVSVLACVVELPRRCGAVWCGAVRWWWWWSCESPATPFHTGAFDMAPERGSSAMLKWLHAEISGRAFGAAAADVRS